MKCITRPKTFFCYKELKYFFSEFKSTASISWRQRKKRLTRTYYFLPIEKFKAKQIFVVLPLLLLLFFSYVHTDNVIYLWSVLMYLYCYLRCTVCLDNPREIMYQDCGHVCACSDCTARYKLIRV